MWQKRNIASRPDKGASRTPVFGERRLTPRQFITLLGGGAAAAWPIAARAQQAAMPVVAFVSGRSVASDSDLVAVLIRALNEAGYVNGQNIAIEFRRADGQLNRFPELLADLVERRGDLRRRVRCRGR